MKIYKSNKLTIFFHFEHWNTEIENVHYDEYRIYFLFWEFNFLKKKGIV